MFFRFYKLGPCATLYPDDVLFAAVIDIFDRIRRNEFTANYRFIVGRLCRGIRDGIFRIGEKPPIARGCV